MSELHSVTLLVIVAIGVLAPLLSEIPIGLRLPVVVLEILLGIVIGPEVLGWVKPEGTVAALGELGLTMLFFMAGMELDLQAIRGRPATLAAAGWAITIVIAALAVLLLYSLDLVRAPLLVGVALTTTAIGTLLPVLRDSGELETEFGRYIMAAGAVGEFGPILVVSLLITREHGIHIAAGLILLFLLIVVAIGWAGLRKRPPKLLALVERTFEASSQLPVRAAMLLLIALVVLAGRFGLDFILGGFAAGMLVRLMTQGSGSRLLQSKMDAIGFGFLIPIFFVLTGVELDVRVLLSDPNTLLRIPLFLGLMLLARGLPTLLYRRELGVRDRLSLAFYSATGLPLLVAITEIGIRSGVMLPENAVALVGAGMLSVLLFPICAGLLRRGAGQSANRVRSDGPEAL